MLRILQPILQLQRGSASAGLSHKTRAKPRKKLMNPGREGGQLIPDYPVSGSALITELMDIKTCNLLIVKFMGGKIKNEWKNALDPMYEFDKPPKSNGWCLSFSEKWLTGDDFVEDCYHTSFDWLMPVVEKIETDFQEYTIEINSFSTCIRLKNGIKPPQFSYHHGDSKIESIYLTVIEFLEWLKSVNEAIS